MRLKHHIYSSILLGGGYYIATKDTVSTLIAMATTIFIDTDHVIDYLLNQKKISSFDKMIKAYETFTYIKRNYFILHSWEFIILAFMYLTLSPNKYIFAASIGWLLHLTLDQIHNAYFLGKYNVNRWFYFIFYRAHFDFNAIKLRVNGANISSNEIIYK